MKISLSQKLQQQFTNLDKSATIYLGFSGGVDSTALLYASRQLSHKIIAVHINHGLNTKRNEWQKFCVVFCEQYNISLKIHQLNLKKSGNLEAIAREARYKIFANYLKKNDIFITAQHRDDQVETVLLRLLRGGGVVGLSAMHPERCLGKGKLVRPWLDFSKSDILNYAQKHGLKWIEDDSNQNTDFDRNFLRHKIIPLLETRWKGLSKTISRSANLCRLSIKESIKSDTFAIENLQNLSQDLANSEIYYWLRGIAKVPPNFDKIQKIVTEIANARVDAKPQITWGGGQVRRYRGALYYLKTPQSLDKITTQYQLKTTIYLKECNLTLINQTDKILTVRFYQGGEKIKTIGADHHKKLKNLFQQNAVLPWLRVNTPLVFIADELVQVVGLCYKMEAVQCKLGKR